MFPFNRADISVCAVIFLLLLFVKKSRLLSSKIGIFLYLGVLLKGFSVRGYV